MYIYIYLYMYIYVCDLKYVLACYLHHVRTTQEHFILALFAHTKMYVYIYIHMCVYTCMYI